MHTRAHEDHLAVAPQLPSSSFLETGSLIGLESTKFSEAG